MYEKKESCWIFACLSPSHFGILLLLSLMSLLVYALRATSFMGTWLSQKDSWTHDDHDDDEKEGEDDDDDDFFVCKNRGRDTRRRRRRTAEKCKETRIKKSIWTRRRGRDECEKIWLPRHRLYASAAGTFFLRFPFWYNKRLERDLIASAAVHDGLSKSFSSFLLTDSLITSSTGDFTHLIFCFSSSFLFMMIMTLHVLLLLSLFLYWRRQEKQSKGIGNWFSESEK